MRGFAAIVFLVVALSIYALLHALVYVRVAGGLNLQGPWRWGFRAALVLAALSFVVGQFAGRTAWGGPVAAVGMTWLGALAIAFTAFALEAAVSWFLPDLRRTLTLATLALVAGIVGYAWYNGTRPPRLVNVSVALDGLPQAAEGFTIVQLSDLHLGRHSSREHLCRLVEDVNRQSPDLVAITGDVIDGGVTGSSGLAQCLAGLSARHGVWAVPGNHDYYAGYQAFERFARQADMRILRNARERLPGMLEVAGVDEPAGRSFAGGGPDLDAALDGRDRSLPVILLSHRPDLFPRFAAKAAGLQLSGHTHAGQIPPLDLIVWFLYQNPWGLGRTGTAQIYTTCGTSTWGPALRLFSRNEFVKITLTRR